VKRPKGYIELCDCGKKAFFRASGGWICRDCYAIEQRERNRTAPGENNKHAPCIDYYTVHLPKRGMIE
jgi:hypothetical protein